MRQDRSSPSSFADAPCRVAPIPKPRPALPDEANALDSTRFLGVHPGEETGEFGAEEQRSPHGFSGRDTIDLAEPVASLLAAPLHGLVASIGHRYQPASIAVITSST